MNEELSVPLCCIVILHFSSSFKLNVGDTHNVSEYSGSRYSGTGAVSLNHHRIFFIAFRSQQDDVVAAFQSVERMVGTHFLKSDRSFSVFQFGYKTPMLMFFLQYLTTGFKVCIETRHPFPEVIQRTFEEVVRNEEILFPRLPVRCGIRLHAPESPVYGSRLFHSGRYAGPVRNSVLPVPS